MRKSNFRINAGCTHTQQPGCAVDEAKSNAEITDAYEKNRSAFREGLAPGWIPYGVTKGASLFPKKV